MEGKPEIRSDVQPVYVDLKGTLTASVGLRGIGLEYGSGEGVESR